MPLSPETTAVKRQVNSETIKKGKIRNHFTRETGTSKSTVYGVYSGNTKYNMRNDLLLDILSQVMDIVYTATIREEEGGTYGVGTMQA